LDDPDHDALARRTAKHDAGALRKDEKRGQIAAATAIDTARRAGRHVDAEDVVEQTAHGITVQDKRLIDVD
jgi:hypothetical protein